MLLSIRSLGFYFLLFLLFAVTGCAPKFEKSASVAGESYGTPKSSHAVHRATMRPYTVAGKRYYPTIVNVGSRFRGIASWYGPDFHGRKTSNGEYYDMYAMTAAHKTLPMNTMVRVKNLRNGKEVVVRINDRGPFVKNRIIDLSYAAARKIGMIAQGTAPVEIEVLGFDKTIASLESSVRGVELKDFAVQIGAFRRMEGAKITKERYATVEGRYRAVIKTFTVDSKPLYRVWLVGFRSEEEARDFIARGEFPGAFVVINE